MNNLVHDRTVVYNIGYHIVWSVKYRRRVLTDKIKESLRQMHMFIVAKPKFSVTYIYKMLKGISSRKLFLKHPEIRNLLCGKQLWNPSTYVEIIGHISEDTVRKYIRDQKIK